MRCDTFIPTNFRYAFFHLIPEVFLLHFNLLLNNPPALCSLDPEMPTRHMWDIPEDKPQRGDKNNGYLLEIVNDMKYGGPRKK